MTFCCTLVIPFFVVATFSFRGCTPGDITIVSCGSAVSSFNVYSVFFYRLVIFIIIKKKKQNKKQKTLNVNNIVVSDPIIDNKKGKRYIVGYNIDGKIISLRIKTPKSVYS